MTDGYVTTFVILLNDMIRSMSCAHQYPTKFIVFHSALPGFLINICSHLRIDKRGLVSHFFTKDEP